MSEKKPEIQIKEILDKQIRVDTEDQLEMDAFMSRTARLLKKSYTAFLREHLAPEQYVRSKDIACGVFRSIEWEDFTNKPKHG